MPDLIAVGAVVVVFSTVALLINRMRPFLGEMEREAATLLRDCLLLVVVLSCLP